MGISRRIGGLMVACLGVAVLAACGESSKGAAPLATNAPAPSQPGSQLYEGEFTVLADKTHPAHLCTGVEESLPPQCSGLPVTNWDWDAVQGEERVRGTIWGGWHVRGSYADGRFTLVGAPTEPAPDSDEPDDVADFSPACDDPDVVDSSAGMTEWENLTQTPEFIALDSIVTGWVSDPSGAWDGPFVGNLYVRPGATDAVVAEVRRHYAGALCVVERDAPTEAELAAVQRETYDAAARAALGANGSGWSDGRRGVVVREVWVADEPARAYAYDRWGDLVELRGNLQPVV